MKRSYFKNQKESERFLQEWNQKVMSKNNRNFEKKWIDTSFGKTYIHCLNEEKKDQPAILIFPGARTCGMVWDLDGALEELSGFRLFIVEVNGQPNLSDGFCPSQKNDDYGKWGIELIDALQLETCFLAGASLGGLICMKIAAYQPKRITRIYLLNSAGLGAFSLKWKNLSMNILPMLFPSRKNIRKFIETIIFHRPTHQLDEQSEELLIGYLHHAITRFKFKGSYPAPLTQNDLESVTTECVILFGSSDPLFPYEKSKAIAQKNLRNIRKIHLFDQVAHGIETYRPALKFIADDLKISNL